MLTISFYVLSSPSLPFSLSLSVLHTYTLVPVAIPGVVMPEAVLDAMFEEVKAAVPGVARVCYDLTGKPPATTEWE